MSTWIALFILALGAMLLVSNDSGMIAGLDSTTCEQIMPPSVWQPAPGQGSPGGRR